MRLTRLALGLPNALVQLQAQYHHCGEAASEKCLSAATFVRWRGDALKASTIRAHRRQAENRTVWNTRSASSVRPRFVVHTDSGPCRAIVAEALIDRQSPRRLVKIHQHNTM